MSPITIFTIGHSTHEAGKFIDILRKNGITLLADVRTVPRSRHNPQFDCDALPATLAAAGIRYVHLKELGGLRHPQADSPNDGLHNASFRGYADYMLTEDFSQALRKLLTLAVEDTVVIMCAEAVPWRCHRSLIGDALLARGIPVRHILPNGQIRPHDLTRFAKVEGERVIYPPDDVTSE